MSQPIVYVDMDDVLCDYQSAYQSALNQNPGVTYPQSVPGFFRCLPPVAGGVSAVTELSQRYDVYILTAPSLYNPHSYMEKRLWIEDHFGFDFTARLIISPNKGLLKGAFLIDDLACGKGQENFEGELIQFGTSDFADWAAVLARLLV